MPLWVTSNLLILFAAGFCFWTSLGSLLPTLPLYIQDIGGTEQQIGWVMGAFAIGLILARPSLGTLADNHSRKLVLLIGIAVAGIAPFTYLFSTHIPLLFGVRAFHGISLAAFTTAYSALVVDLADPKQRGEIIGYMSLVTPIGVAFGTAFGGGMLELGNYSLLFGCAGLFGVVGFALVSQVYDPYFQSARNQSARKKIAPQLSQLTNASPCPPHSSIRIWEYLMQPRLRILAWILFVIGISFGALSTFMPLHVKDLGINFNPGLFYTAAAIASFSVRLMIGQASDKFGRGRFISLSLIIYGLAMLCLWLGKSPEIFILSGVLEGIGAGLILPMVSALLADRSTDDERAKVFSICMGGFDIGLAIAGPLFGSFSELIQLPTIFLLASVLCGVGFLSFVCFGNQTLKRSLQFALSNGKDRYAIAHSLS